MSSLPTPFACALAEIAQDAARLVLRHFQAGAPPRQKRDGSLVTDADQEAEALILAGLHRLAPDVPVIAEEQMAETGGFSPGRRFFLVDPLDGTEEFVRGNGEFTVNIGLIEDGEAVCGVVLAPAKGRAFVGEKAGGAFELSTSGGMFEFAHAKPIQARHSGDRLTVLVSRTHRGNEADAYINGSDILPVASSLKFGLLAAGEADLYPRTGPTMEWDTAAGQAVLQAAGGSMHKMDGAPFRYGKLETGFRNPGFIARGKI